MKILSSLIVGSACLFLSTGAWATGNDYMPSQNRLIKQVQIAYEENEVSQDPVAFVNKVGRLVAVDSIQLNQTQHDLLETNMPVRLDDDLLGQQVHFGASLDHHKQ